MTSSSFRGLEYIEDIPFDAIILHQDVSGLTPRDMVRILRNAGNNTPCFILHSLPQTYDGLKNGFNGVIPFPYTPLEFASTLRPFLPIPQEDKHLMNSASSLDRSSISTEEPDGRSPVSIAHSHNGQSSNRDLTVDLEDDDGLADFLSDSLDCSSAFEQYSGDMAPASGLKRKRGVIA